MLVIIGCGLAGYMLAKEWRKLDQQTPLLMITTDDGAFYSKPLLSNAFTQQKIPDQLMVSSAANMAQELNAKISCYANVTAIDPHNNTLTVDHQSFHFSRLVLACGAEVVAPKLSGDAVKEIISVNTLSDYRYFRQWLENKKHIAILGSGLVGCEFANDLANAGYTVTIIAPDPHPLAAWIPPELGQSLQQALTQCGIHWQLGHSATAVNYRQGQIAVSLSNGQEILAEGVLSAIGLRPRIHLAKSAGIHVHRGIVVNRQLQTNFSHIFALGDCAEIEGEVRMFVAPLLQSARVLAKILVDQKESVDFPVMPIVLKTPALPLVFVPVQNGVKGQWQIEGEGHHLRALFYDQKNDLRGFVLSGDKVRDRMSLAKQLSSCCT